MTDTRQVSDIFVIGGGINGCGIARDAAGRGLKVTLAEMNDLASATSSSSTKLIHGGLRYLEFFEIRLVREALEEREVLLRAMPHISWPMRFVLPVYKDMRFDSTTPASRLLTRIMPWMRGRRPAWMIRLGLFLYDHLGGRKILPGTAKLSLNGTPEGTPLDDKYQTAYEYSDCWVQDARLVVLNARDAQARGATILPRTKVTGAERGPDHWTITTEGADGTQTHHARLVINAGGPWVADLIQGTLRQNATAGIRLVRGSHIVTRKLFDHDKCYFFQGSDGRIIFAIPYEDDFTLIGTTDQEHGQADDRPHCTEEEADYLCAFASAYFKTPVTRDDVVWTYSGIRPLYDDGATSATAATREYVLRLNTDGGAPLLNIFGGKITTYRKLAEAALADITPFFPHAGAAWTAGIPLPGGDFEATGQPDLINALSRDYPFLDAKWARRLVRTYGTETRVILGDATSTDALGEDFGAGITAAELDFAIAREWVCSAEDFIWRRTKLGLRLDQDQIARIDAYIRAASAPTITSTG